MPQPTTGPAAFEAAARARQNSSVGRVRMNAAEWTGIVQLLVGHSVAQRRSVYSPTRAASKQIRLVPIADPGRTVEISGVVRVFQARSSASWSKT